MQQLSPVIFLKRNSEENWPMKNESFLISVPDSEKLLRVNDKVLFFQ